MADARDREKLCKTVISCTLQTMGGGEDSRLMDEATAHVCIWNLLSLSLLSVCRRLPVGGSTF